MAKLTLTVPDALDNCRLDAFLRRYHGFSSRTITSARHRPGGFLMNGIHIRTVDPVKAGAVITVDMGEEACQTPPCDAPVPVLWYDEHLCVLDKPAGMPTHQSLGHPTGTLANVFAGLPCALGRAFRPVGRLDRDTSGLVSAAMHPHAAYRLAKRMHKTYFALVGGKLDGEGEINAPVFTDPATPIRSVHPAGQAAVTRWKALCCDNNRTLVALFPQTGRTHQLRVHMAHIGFPLLGDALYGGDMGEIGRHALHCGHLCIDDYFGEGDDLSVVSPLPADMAALLCDDAQQQADRFLKGLMKGAAPC